MIPIWYPTVITSKEMGASILYRRRSCYYGPFRFEIPNASEYPDCHVRMDPVRYPAQNVSGTTSMRNPTRKVPALVRDSITAIHLKSQNSTGSFMSGKKDLQQDGSWNSGATCGGPTSYTRPLNPNTWPHS